MLFLLQIIWYSHGTHAYSSARYPLQSYGSTRNSAGVIWGHRGQKVIFTKNLVVVVLRSPIHANEPSEYKGMLYRTSNRVLNNGIKVIILICMDGTSQYHHHQKFCFSFRLHGMVVGLMHIHQLDTHYKRYGSRNSHRVIWGHGVKESFSPKMLFLLQFTWHNNDTQAY